MFKCALCGCNHSILLKFKFNPGKDPMLPCRECGKEMVGEYYFIPFIVAGVIFMVSVISTDASTPIYFRFAAFFMCIIVFYLSVPIRSSRAG
jgi:hypothetical protein